MSNDNGTNGTGTKSWARIVFDNLLRIHASPPQNMLKGETREQYRERRALAASLKRDEGETSKQYRERVLRLIGERWNGASAVSVAKFIAPATSSSRRRPTLKSHPKFFEDLRRFGGVKFKGKGDEIVQSTLDTGPDYEQFHHDTPPGSDTPRPTAL